MRPAVFVLQEGRQIIDQLADRHVAAATFGKIVPRQVGRAFGFRRIRICGGLISACFLPAKYGFQHRCLFWFAISPKVAYQKVSARTGKIASTTDITTALNPTT
jgi:hypothetical protein